MRHVQKKNTAPSPLPLTIGNSKRENFFFDGLNIISSPFIHDSSPKNKHKKYFSHTARTARFSTLFYY